MTYRALCTRLSTVGIDSAEWDAALLIEHFCGVDASLVRLDPDRDYLSDELEKAASARETRYPLQYLLGEWQFYRQTYTVSPDCLIPRADTEILVETAIERLPKDAYFADLCTGSGCIAISVLAERPDTRALAVEKYPRTLEIATQNAVRNRVRSRFEPQCDDVLTPICTEKTPIFDAILSNPPYIPNEVIKGLAPEVLAEPQVALDGGKDGLLFYRSILKNYTPLLKSDGFFLFEIGFDQAESLSRLAREYGFSVFHVLRDYGGQDRVVWLQR